MGIRKLIFIIFFTCLAFEVASQIPIMPEQFRVNLGAKDIHRDMSFYQLQYRTSTVDLRKLKPMVKQEIPDSVVIVPPDLSSFDHVVVLVGLVGNDASNMVLWLAGNYNYRNITFFLDYDQDRNFVNDEGPVRIKAGADPVEVMLAQNNQNRKLLLTVPEVEVRRIEKYKVRIANRFAVGLSMGVGTGDINYQYDDLVIGYPTSYFVKITEKNLTATLSYDTRLFNVGVSASFQNHYYFTTHLDVVKGEPFYRRLIDFIWLYDDNTDHHVNLDEHSNNRVQLGVFGSLKLKISRAIDIHTTFRTGLTSYFNPTYNRFVHQEDQIYPLRTSPFYEVGVRVEFTTGIERAVFVEFARNEQKWEPEGFLADTPHENFESSSVMAKLNVGYRFTLK